MIMWDKIFLTHKVKINDAVNNDKLTPGATKLASSAGYFIMVNATDQCSNIIMKAGVALRKCVHVSKPQPHCQELAW